MSLLPIAFRLDVNRGPAVGELEETHLNRSQENASGCKGDLGRRNTTSVLRHTQSLDEPTKAERAALGRSDRWDLKTIIETRRKG